MYFLHKLEELPDFICKGFFFHERGKMYMSINNTVNNDVRDAFLLSILPMPCTENNQ